MKEEENENDGAENKEGGVAGGGAKRAPNSFVEGSLHGIVTKKGDFDGGSSEEGTKYPGELGSHEGIATNPGCHRHAGNSGVGSGCDEHSGEMDICHHPGEGDERSVDQRPDRKGIARWRDQRRVSRRNLACGGTIELESVWQ